MKIIATVIAIFTLFFVAPRIEAADHRDCTSYCDSMCQDAIEDYHDGLGGCSNFGFGYVTANYCRMTTVGLNPRTLATQQCIGDSSGLTCVAGGKMTCSTPGGGRKTSSYSQTCGTRTAPNGAILLPQQRVTENAVMCDYNDTFSVWLLCDENGNISESVAY